MFHCGLAVLPRHTVVTDSFRCKTFLTCGHRKLRSCFQVANESTIALNFKFSVILVSKFMLHVFLFSLEFGSISV